MKYVSTVMTGCAAALLCATQLMAATQSQPASTSKQADRLLREMRLDAQTIETDAMAMERLANDPHAQWAQFDQEWNAIKPAQEQLEMRARRLESTRASLSDPQRKALDETKQAVQTIAARTRELFGMVDQQGANLQSPKFRSDVRSLAASAKSVAQVLASGA